MDRHALSTLRVGGVTAAAMLGFVIACAAADSVALGTSEAPFGIDPTGELPPVEVTYAATCRGLFCTFDASSSIDPARTVKWVWDWCDGTSVTRTSPIATKIFATPGTCDNTLTITNTLGLSASVTRTDTLLATRTDTLLAEPIGMTKLTETGFNCVNGCGEWSFWNPSYAHGATLVIDSTAPKSPGNVVQQTYTSALTAGTSPMASGFTFTQKQTIYVAIWMKLSSNFQGHGSGVNKVLHFFTAGGKNIAILNMRGAGTGAPLAPEILLQGIGIPLTYRSFGSEFTHTSTEQNLTSNPAVCTALRGKWTRFEVVLTGNAAGVANGRAEIWMDGVKCIDVPNIGFFASDQVSAWKDIWWSPTWGGVGGSPSQTFSESVDHIYVSGK